MQEKWKILPNDKKETVVNCLLKIVPAKYEIPVNSQALTAASCTRSFSAVRKYFR